jgi:UDP-glucose 4-epimerase
MKYLVTGGAGFIGSNLVDALIEQGHQVEIWDALKTGKEENINPKATFNRLYVDLIDIELYKGQRYDAIFHLAAEARIQPSFERPKETHHSNVTATLNVLHLAKEIGSKVVFAGSSSVYHDNYANPYSFTKKIGEEYCTMFNKVYGVPVAIARFFNVYGPRQLETGAYATVIGIFEKQYRSKEPLTITGDGEQRRDFTHVSDIVAGLIAMSKEDYKADIFNLGTGTNHSINELAKMFKHEYVYIPKRRGEAETTLADINFSKRELGYQPKVKLEDYIDSIVCK